MLPESELGCWGCVDPGRKDRAVSEPSRSESSKESDHDTCQTTHKEVEAADA